MAAIGSVKVPVWVGIVKDGEEPPAGFSQIGHIDVPIDFSTWYQTFPANTVGQSLKADVKLDKDAITLTGPELKLPKEWEMAGHITVKDALHGYAADESFCDEVMHIHWCR